MDELPGNYFNHQTMSVEEVPTEILGAAIRLPLLQSKTAALPQAPMESLSVPLPPVTNKDLGIDRPDSSRVVRKINRLTSEILEIIEEINEIIKKELK